MERFLSKLTDLAYDVVGVLMPGLSLLLVGGLQWGLYRHYTDSGATGLRLLFLLREDVAAAERHPWGALLGVLLCSYFAGRVVLFLARDGLPIVGSAVACVGAVAGRRLKVHAEDPLKKPAKGASLIRLLARMLLVRTPKRLLDTHADSLLPIMKWCAQAVAPDSDKDSLHEWSAFYPVASGLLEQERAKSRFPIHQNKYTLDRSLATVFALGFWSAIAICILLGSGRPLLEAAAFLLLVYIFDQEHAYHWRLWGDSIIAETYALVWRKRNERGHDNAAGS